MGCDSFFLLLLHFEFVEIYICSEDCVPNGEKGGVVANVFWVVIVVIAGLGAKEWVKGHVVSEKYLDGPREHEAGVAF